MARGVKGYLSANVARYLQALISRRYHPGRTHSRRPANVVRYLLQALISYVRRRRL
jgi:hypothetical protein